MIIRVDDGEKGSAEQLGRRIAKDLGAETLSRRERRCYEGEIGH